MPKEEPVAPTAQTLVGEPADTPLSMLNDPGLGLGTCDHALPFHCTMSVWLLFVAPTAQPMVGESMDTLER